MGVDHYENFPVASRILPARLRPPVVAIYRFARTADDIADEGDAPAAARLHRLAELGGVLDAIENPSSASSRKVANWPDLAAAVRQHRLPIALLRDLLSAFAQDVNVHRYADFASLNDYCRRSANPIGRLLLHLYEVRDELAAQQSDAICTALQMANFWQDVAIDWRKDRVYIPQASLRQFAVSEAQIAHGRSDGAWSALMASLTAQTRTLMRSGMALPQRLGGRVGWELRLVIQGGLRVLERIDRVDGDVFAQRPQLNWRDWMLLVARAVAMRVLPGPRGGAAVQTSS